MFSLLSTEFFGYISIMVTTFNKGIGTGLKPTPPQFNSCLRPCFISVRNIFSMTTYV